MTKYLNIVIVDLNNRLELTELNFHNDTCSKCELCNKSCPMGIEVKQIAQKKAQENKKNWEK